MKIYWHVLLLQEGGDNTTSTPKPSGDQGGAKPKVSPQPTQPNLNFTRAGTSVQPIKYECLCTKPLCAKATYI